MSTFKQVKAGLTRSKAKKTEAVVTAGKQSLLRNLTSMDSSNNNLFNHNAQSQPKTQELSRIPEQTERPGHPRAKEPAERPVKKSRLSLSQMGNKKSQSGSKSNSGMSNFGSLTIKMSSREEELPTGSSKNPKFEISEESIQNMKQKLLNEQKYIQEENEKSQNSQINCSDYTDNEESSDCSRQNQKQSTNIAFIPVPELEEDKESEDQVENKATAKSNEQSSKQSRESQSERNTEEAPQPESARDEKQEDGLQIPLTRSRSGRIRRKPKDESQFLLLGPKKNKIFYQSKKAKGKMVSCNCTQSKCLSSYCICFKTNQYCSTRCNCQDCVFNKKNQELVKEIKRVELELNPLQNEHRFQKIVAKVKGKDNLMVEQGMWRANRRRGGQPERVHVRQVQVQEQVLRVRQAEYQVLADLQVHRLPERQDGLRDSAEAEAPKADPTRAQAGGLPEQGEAGDRQEGPRHAEPSGKDSGHGDSDQYLEQRRPGPSRLDGAEEADHQKQ